MLRLFVVRDQPASRCLFSSFSFLSMQHLQVNLVDWLKQMVSNRNAEGVLDPKFPQIPSSRALKRVLLVALRCVDPNAQKRPKMGNIVHMLEAEELPLRDVSLHSLFLLFEPRLAQFWKICIWSIKLCLLSCHDNRLS